MIQSGRMNACGKLGSQPNRNYFVLHPIQQWLSEYACRRYGAPSKNATKAWEILLQNPYKKGTTGVEKSSIIAARPALKVKKSGPNAGFKIPYDPAQLVVALDLLLKDRQQFTASDAYRYDLVDLTRQILSNLGQVLNKEAAAAFESGDATQFKLASDRFLDLLKDTDRVLATRSEFSFGKWLADAQSWGKTSAEKAYYQKNAAMLVTLWGPEKAPTIFDYSWREWSGLIHEYYLPRWEKFYAFLAEELAEGKAYSDPDKKVYGREAFRANDFYNQLADWEIQWVSQPHALTATPVGDELEEVQKILKKYRPFLEKAYAAKAEGDEN